MAEPPHLGGMRFGLLLLAGVALVAPLAGQAAIRLTAGATYSTSLVDDGVLSTKLRPAIAPTAGLALSYPTGKGPYRVLAEVSYDRAPLNVTSRDNVSQDQLAAVASITTLVLVEGTLRGPLRWQVGGGAVLYQPMAREGVFQNGSAHRWMFAGGLVWSHPITTAMELLISGRVDGHTFTTTALQARGYGGAQSVQRLGILVGVNRRL